LSKYSRCPVADLSTAVPILLTPDEVAGILRTSKKAIYVMAQRGQLPGVVRVGRRLLFDQSDLVRFLAEQSKPLPGRSR
jgi:excisionase family DNA binding protein